MKIQWIRFVRAWEYQRFHNNKMLIEFTRPHINIPVNNNWKWNFYKEKKQIKEVMLSPRICFFIILIGLVDKSQ